MRGYINKIIVTLLLLTLTLILPTQPALGAEATPDELIIIFDTSTSMGWNDTEFLAPDALRQLVASLPSSYHVGLVSFNIDVVEAIAPGANSRPDILAALDRVAYTNFTNSGSGLFRAMELFSDHASSRTIVFMTDGEKANMPTSAQTEAAFYQADTAIGLLTASEITVHTIAVGTDFDQVDPSILNLAPASGGYLFENVTSAKLSDTVSSLAFDALGVSNSLVGAAQVEGSTGTFTVRIPTAGPDLARVLITGESAIDHIVASATGSDVVIQTGERFAVVDVFEPTEQMLHIEFTTMGTSQAELILEWDLVLQATPSEPLRFWLSNSAGENVLHDPFFDSRVIPLTVDGADVQLRAEDGYLHWPEGDAYPEHVRANLEYFGINIVGGSPALTLPPRETPPPEPGLTILILTVSGLLLAIILLIFIFRRRSEKEKEPNETPAIDGVPTTGRRRFRRKRALQPSAPLPLGSAFEFTGKLNLYVTNTPNDIDIPPQTFDLFRLNRKEEVSLRDVLQKCHVPEGFSGVEGIRFSAGKHGNVYVSNDSDCTILLGRDLLLKNRSRALEYGEKLHVTCTDEISELELHYRSVKPQERQVEAIPLLMNN